MLTHRERLVLLLLVGVGLVPRVGFGGRVGRDSTAALLLRLVLLEGVVLLLLLMGCGVSVLSRGVGVVTDGGELLGERTLLLLIRGVVLCWETMLGLLVTVHL